MPQEDKSNNNKARRRQHKEVLLFEGKAECVFMSPSFPLEGNDDEIRFTRRGGSQRKEGSHEPEKKENIKRGIKREMTEIVKSLVNKTRQHTTISLPFSSILCHLIQFNLQMMRRKEHKDHAVHALRHESSS